MGRRSAPRTLLDVVRTIGPMQAFHSDRHLLPLPPGHRFPRSKYRLLRERVASLADLEAHEAEPVGDAELIRVHDPSYVAAVTSGTLAAAEQRAIGFPWSEETGARAEAAGGDGRSGTPASAPLCGPTAGWPEERPPACS